MIRLFIISLISISYSFASCDSSDKYKICYLKHQLKYEKLCWKNKLNLSNYKEKSEKDTSIESLDYKISKYRNLDRKDLKEPFHYCFQPVSYYKMICRKKVCGYYNKR